MKHRITLLMALVGAMFFSQSVCAQDYAGSVTLDDGITIYYNFQGDRITICAPANETWNGFNMPVGDLVIPASITHQGVSYPVTEIEPKAFQNCIDITSVIIPNSVNYISYNAFFECSGITSLTIGSSVIDISNGAFAFCSALEEIHFRSANPPTLNGNAFLDHNDVPVYVPCGSLLSYSGWGGFTDIRGESEKVKIGSLWYLLDCDNHSATVVPELSVPQQIISPLYSNHSCPSGDITIPASVGYGNQTFAVTAIGDGAFAYCQNISSIVIPESVTSIGNSAFRSCDVMESLTIGNSVTSIGNKAFGYCLTLESVNIPNSVISIGNNAFEHCYSLTSVTIGNSVTTIGNEAFISCIALSSLTIGNSVTSLGNKSFFACYYLSSLTIGNSVTTIGNEAFSGCNHLTEVHLLASNPPSLGSDVFIGVPHNIPLYVPCGTLSDYLSASGWSSFTNIQNEDDCFTVTVSANNPEMGTTEGGNGYYLYWAEPTLTATPKCGYRFVHWINVDGDEVSTDAEFTIVVTRDTSLTAVFEVADRVLIDGLWYSLDHEHSTAKVVPEKNTPPYYETDHKPTGALVIPSSVTYCNNDYTVTAIDANAFYSCSDLTGTLVIPNTVISIGMNAFYKCTGLTGPLNLPESIVSLGKSAFNRCSGFSSLSLPNSISNIDDGTFSKCTGFSGILVIPSSVVNIGRNAFEECIGFSGSLVIPNSVARIRDGAFYYCNHITSLTIGSAVANIDEAAFRRCEGLESIVVECATPPTLGSNVFYQCPMDIPVTVPCNSVVAYQATNGWSSFSHIQEVSTCPRTVTATSADEAMGTVSGGGTYTPGATATLTATPACFHRFVRWKNTNDETVSTDASFDLTVTHDTALTAVFKTTDTVLVNGLWYRLNQTNHTATVVPETKHNPYYVNTPKPTGELAIPSIVSYCGNDYTVTKIGANAFFNCTGLTGNVTIPNTVTSISEYAFFYCTGITSLTIGSAVSSIDVLAFRFCARLQSIVVESATPPTLGANAFANCPTGIPVTVPCNSLAAYQTANRWSSFTHIQEASTCTHTVTVTVDDPSMGTVSGDGTYTVGATATLTATPNCGYRFVQWTSNSTPVSTDNPVSFIVTKDTALTAVFEEAAKVMIDGLWYSLDCEFGYATVVPENNTEPYYSTAPAGDIVIPANIEYGGSTYKVRHIGEYAFYGCSDITSVTLPNRFDHIASYAFYGCSGLTSINLPNSIYGIGIYAFYGCSGLTSLSIPSSVTRIDSETFKNCTGLSSINIPYGVTYIAVASFEGCTSLTSVNIPNSVTTLYGFSFSGCTGLTSVTLGSAINRIGVGAFSGCRNLTSIIIPNGVTSIEQTTFSSCINLTSVTLGSGITSINEGAFRNCTSLTSITLPDGVTSIGPSAFEDCTNLITINIPDAVTSISQSAFDGCSSLASITIPDGVTTLYNYTFSGCSSMTSVTIGSGVTTIGGYVFWQCGSLEEIHSFASLPPSLGDGVFGYVSRSIPVNVPCGKVSAYQNASGWGEFTSIREMDGCTHTVTATSADEAMGSVTGGGSYPHGGEATLTATANEGYHFVQWNDGSDVNPRSLTVTQDTTFTASFAPTTVYTTVDSNVCDNKFPITWNGVTFSDAGTETATLQNHLGADSIVTMNVHLKHTSTGDTTAVEFDQFTWYGHTYYQSTSTPTHLLTNAAGCDSTVTLHLTINPSHVGEFEITATADDAARGTVSGGGRYDAGDEVTLKASASCGYQFLQWSDGITDNPRTISVAGNASYTAQFQQANYIFQTPSGQMLNYAVDCETQTACVTGYTGVCRGLLVIPPLIRIEGVIYVVVSIGPSAFENNTGLLRVMIPGTVDAIYQSAFKGCTNLAKVEGWYQLKGLE